MKIIVFMITIIKFATKRQEYEIRSVLSLIIHVAELRNMNKKDIV